MGVSYEWTNLDHVVVHTYIEHPWTWDDYQLLFQKMMDEIRQENHPVATLVNISHMKSFPAGANIMDNLRRIEAAMAPNVFGSVLVGAPHVAVSFMNVMMQLRPKSKELTLFSDTVQGGLALLAKRYQELYPDGDLVDKILTVSV
jgi:hypothetical protein